MRLPLLPPLSRWSAVSAAAAVLLALTPLRSVAQAADTKLAAFFRGYLDERFRLEPLAATQLGEHRFDDRLEDVSAEARAGWTAHARATLQTLPQAVDFARLSRAGQIDFEIFRHDLETGLWLTEQRLTIRLEEIRDFGGKEWKPLLVFRHLDGQSARFSLLQLNF